MLIEPTIEQLAKDLLPNTSEYWVHQLAREMQRAYVGTLEQIEEYLADRSDEGDLGNLTVMGASKR